MSWQATVWVIEHSQHKGSALLVMLMIANCANAEGSDAFPGIAKLTKDTRLKERHVYRLISTLETGGELAVKRKNGRPNHYSFPLMTPDKMSGVAENVTPVIAKAETPDISSATPDLAMTPDPSLERLDNSHSPAREGNQERAMPPKSARSKAIGKRPQVTSAPRPRKPVKPHYLPDDFVFDEDHAAVLLASIGFNPPEEEIARVVKQWELGQRSDPKMSADWQSNGEKYLMGWAERVLREGTNPQSKFNGPKKVQTSPYDPETYEIPVDYEFMSREEQQEWHRQNNVPWNQEWDERYCTKCRRRGLIRFVIDSEELCPPCLSPEQRKRIGETKVVAAQRKNVAYAKSKQQAA